MAKRTHKYYLKVDDHVVDFSRLQAFPKMESFLRLSVFTGLFRDKKELLKALKEMGLIPSTENSTSLEIVKLKRKHGEKFFSLVAPISTYREEAAILSQASLYSFFHSKRRHYPVILEILSLYKRDTESLISIFMDKICALDEELAYCQASYRDELRADLEERQKSLLHFQKSRENLSKPIGIASRLNDRTGSVKDFDLEYVQRLHAFVDYETNYVTDQNKIPNYRRIARLAHIVKLSLDEHPSLKSPESTTKHDGLKAQLLSAIKSAISEARKSPKERTGSPVDDSEEIYLYDVDPDAYMFLDDDDYRRLLGEDSTPEEREDIEIEIEWLKEKKRGGRRGKIY